jgi:hypothetical protein
MAACRVSRNSNGCPPGSSTTGPSAWPGGGWTCASSGTSWRRPPAAEAAAGHEREAEADVLSLSQRVDDVVHPDTTEEADAFRPIYIEYLLEHEPDQD